MQQEDFLKWLCEEKKIVLNPQQLQAVLERNGKSLLIATPGSGKTTVIVCRTALLLCVENVPRERILTLTYGKQSQLDMDARFADLFSELPKPRFSTIHALCLEILRRYTAASGGEMFEILQNSSSVVRTLLSEQTGSYVGEELLSNVLAALEYVCNQMLSREQISKMQVEDCDFPMLYEAYTAWKRQKKQMDFGDLLTFANRALEKYPTLLEAYREQYDYIQVDEAQDTSPIQQVLIDKLAGENKSLFLVGDEDQSIYGFRGADPQYLLRFEETHSGAAVRWMETNYRSGRQIVEAASRIIQYNAYRRQKSMTAWKTSEGISEKVLLRDWNAQGEYAVQRARELAPGNTLGILFRNNDSMPVLCDALLHAEIPFTVSRRDGKPGLFTHHTLRALRAFLRLSFNPEDGEAFYEVRNRIKRGIPSYVAAKIRRGEGDVFEGLCRELRLSGSDLEAVQRRAEKIASLKRMRPYMAVSEVVDTFHLDARGANAAKTDALMTLAMQVNTLDEYTAKLEELELLLETDPPCGGRVFLSTIHGAKGLEYDEVILCDARDGVLPASNLRDTPEQRKAFEEETRLMYVAVTRARNRFTLLTANSSHGMPAKPSLYADRIFPPVARSRNLWKEEIHAERGQIAQKKSVLAAAIFERDAQKWMGQNVRHTRFGEGKVLSVKNGLAVIRFSDGERKMDLKTCLSAGVLRRQD